MTARSRVRPTTQQAQGLRQGSQLPGPEIFGKPGSSRSQGNIPLVEPRPVIRTGEAEPIVAPVTVPMPK